MPDSTGISGKRISQLCIATLTLIVAADVEPSEAAAACNEQDCKVLEA